MGYQWGIIMLPCILLSDKPSLPGLSSLQYLFTIVLLSHTLLMVPRSHWLFGPCHPTSQLFFTALSPSVSWVSWCMNKNALKTLLLEGSWLPQCGHLSIRVYVQWCVCVGFCVQNASQSLHALPSLDPAPICTIRLPDTFPRSFLPISRYPRHPSSPIWKKVRK